MKETRIVLEPMNGAFKILHDKMNDRWFLINYRTMRIQNGKQRAQGLDVTDHVMKLMAHSNGYLRAVEEELIKAKGIEGDEQAAEYLNEIFERTKK